MRVNVAMVDQRTGERWVQVWNCAEAFASGDFIAHYSRLLLHGKYRPVKTRWTITHRPSGIAVANWIWEMDNALVLLRAYAGLDGGTREEILRISQGSASERMQDAVALSSRSGELQAMAESARTRQVTPGDTDGSARSVTA